MTFIFIIDGTAWVQMDTFEFSELELFLHIALEKVL